MIRLDRAGCRRAIPHPKRALNQSLAHGPNGHLRTIGCGDLSRYVLHVLLDGVHADFQRACNSLVAQVESQLAQTLGFTLGKWYVVSGASSSSTTRRIFITDVIRFTPPVRQSINTAGSPCAAGDRQVRKSRHAIRRSGVVAPRIQVGARHLASSYKLRLLLVEGIWYNGVLSPLEGVVVGVFPASMFRDRPPFLEGVYAKTRIGHGQCRKEGGYGFAADGPLRIVVHHKPISKKGNALWSDRHLKRLGIRPRLKKHSSNRFATNGNRCAMVPLCMV